MAEAFDGPQILNRLSPGSVSEQAAGSHQGEEKGHILDICFLTFSILRFKRRFLAASMATRLFIKDKAFGDLSLRIFKCLDICNFDEIFVVSPGCFLFWPK